MSYKGMTREEYHRQYLQRNPWKVSQWGAKRRCTWKNDPYYHRYGGRGIKFLMTSYQIKELWFRDKAKFMDKPSLDRIDNDGNYEFSNCRFIENVINGGRHNREKTHCLRGHEFNQKNTWYKKSGRHCKLCQKILS